MFERISGACADSSDSLVSFLENRCSKRGVYRSELLDFIGNFGASDRIRTCDPCLRRAVLYPAELRMREARSPMKSTEKRKYRSEEHMSDLLSLMRISHAVFCLTKKQNAR